MLVGELYLWPFAKKVYHGWVSMMTSSNEILWKLPPPKWRAGCASDLDSTLNPLTPTRATTVASTLLTINGPLSQKAVQTLYGFSKSSSWNRKKNVFRFRWEFFWRWRHNEGMFGKFWPPLASPGLQLIDPFCWLKVLLKTRSKSASIEPLIDLLAYL